jgi:hypothetical protein
MRIRGHPHPWNYFGHRFPEVKAVFVDDLPRFRRAETRWPLSGATPYIAIANGLTVVERRCALFHEVQHLELGKPCGTSRRDEDRAIERTARWLLPCLPRVAKEMRAGTHRDAASGLWVTYTVLVDRLRRLSDAELDHLAAMRDEVDTA